MNANTQFAFPDLQVPAPADRAFAPQTETDAGEQRVARLRLAEIPVIGLPLETPAETSDKKAKKAKKAKKSAEKAIGKAKGDEKAKRAGKDNPESEFGSARGVETVFRSSYRTQLNLTALAATKANIMISLNGFILSVLTLSGPFVLVAEPMFTMPIAIFLATCLASIIFAVLAARPRFRKSRRTPEDFASDKANVLVFEEFASLSEEQHTEAMLGLLKDNGRIYRNMSRQLYVLGSEANRKFRLLSISYAAFLTGLTLSTLLLLGIGFFHHTPDFAGLLSQLQGARAG